MLPAPVHAPAARLATVATLSGQLIKNITNTRHTRPVFINAIICALGALSK
jgi:hypothetical protein